MTTRAVITRKRLLTIMPHDREAPARRIVVTTTSDGKETPYVMHGEVGVTFRWDDGGAVTYPWTSIFALIERPVEPDFLLPEGWQGIDR